MGRAAKRKRKLKDKRQRTAGKRGRHPLPTEAAGRAAGDRAMERLRQELAGDSKTLFVVEPAAAIRPKASDRLEALIEPWLSLLQAAGAEVANLHELFLLGALAWNAQSLADGRGQEPPELVAQLLSRARWFIEGADIDLGGGDELGLQLLQRKWALFADDRRVLVRLVLEEASRGWAGLSVASTLSRGGAAIRAARDLSQTLGPLVR